MREIMRETSVPIGTLKYHLSYLEKEDLIISRKEDRYKRFYVEGKHTSFDKKVLGIIRQPQLRRILIFLLLETNAGYKIMIEELGISASTLSSHLKRLLEAGMITQDREGRQKTFSVTDPDNVARTIITYKKTFLDELVMHFASAWEEMHP